MATISSRPEIESYPFSNVFSVSDGATTATSSGVPYFYLSVLEMSVHDLQVIMYQYHTISRSQQRLLVTFYIIC